MKNKVFNYGIEYFDRLEAEHQKKRWQNSRLWWHDNKWALLGSIILLALGYVAVLIAFQWPI